jgi:hypothetical protein
MFLGFKSFVCCRLVAVWWMVNKWSFCFILTFHNFATLKNLLTYQYPSSWPVVITMKEKLAGTWKKKERGYWPVQINGNKFATGQILKKPVEVVKGRILAGWAQSLTNPEPVARGNTRILTDYAQNPLSHGIGLFWSRSVTKVGTYVHPPCCKSACLGICGNRSNMP